MILKWFWNKYFYPYRYVWGPDLAACARDLYHRYRDCKDADSYLAGEKLHDVILLPVGTTAVLAILACGDCAVILLYNYYYIICWFCIVKLVN